MLSLNLNRHRDPPAKPCAQEAMGKRKRARCARQVGKETQATHGKAAPTWIYLFAPPHPTHATTLLLAAWLNGLEMVWTWFYEWFGNGLMKHGLEMVWQAGLMNEWFGNGLTYHEGII
jgi:hypothetical protein